MRRALFLILFDEGLASVLLKEHACPEGELWNNCAINPVCEVNCQKTHKNYCDRLCYQRCQCSETLIRDLESGQCLPSAYCPRDFLAQPECPENEVWNSCGNLCDGTCSRPEIECPKICAEGACACAKEHVRNERGKCVPFKECVSTPECPENEFWNECGNLCEGTCDEPLKNCPKICAEPSCTCLNNFVRNELGNCIAQDNCKPTIHCQENAVYKKCGTNCPETCESARLDFPVLCALSCNPSCQCIDGYVLDANGNCIAREHCWKSHPECPANSHFNDCGTNCPETCDTYLSGIPVFCNFGCNSACQCDKGFVLDENHNCIPEKECRLSTPECPDNSSYNSCGTNCEETCESVLSETPSFCNFGCNDGCFCDKGYVRNDRDGNCVPIESCEKIPKILVTCEEGREWSECKAQKYCNNIQSDDFDDGNLSTFCEPGCQCNQGLYENNDGLCVSYEQCVQVVESVSDSLTEDLGLFFESLIGLSNDTIDHEQIYGIIEQLGGNLTTLEKELEKLFADVSYHPGPNSYQNGVEYGVENYDNFAEVGQLISSLAEGIPDFDPCGGFGDGINQFLCKRSCQDDDQCYVQCTAGLCVLSEIDQFDEINSELVAENNVPEEIFALYGDINKIFKSFENSTDFDFNDIKSLLSKWDLGDWLEQHFCNFLGKKISIEDVERVTTLSIGISKGDYTVINELTSLHEEIISRPIDYSCFKEETSETYEYTTARTTTSTLEFTSVEEEEMFDPDKFNDAMIIIETLAQSIPDFSPCANIGDFLCRRSCEDSKICVEECTRGLCNFENIEFDEITEEMVVKSNVPYDIFSLYSDFFEVFNSFENLQTFKVDKLGQFLTKWELEEFVERHFCEHFHKFISIEDVELATSFIVEIAKNDYSWQPRPINDLVQFYEEVIARSDVSSCETGNKEELQGLISAEGHKHVPELLFTDQAGDNDGAESIICPNKYELFVDCGPKQHCRLTCESYYTGTKNDCEELVCVPGCICPFGWILNKTQEKCVRDPRQCSIPYHLYMPYV